MTRRDTCQYSKQIVSTMERPANLYHTTLQQYHTIILEDKRYNSLPGPCRAQLTRPQHPSLPDRQIRAGCIGRTFAYIPSSMADTIRGAWKLPQTYFLRCIFRVALGNTSTYTNIYVTNWNSLFCWESSAFLFRAGCPPTVCYFGTKT